MNGGEKDVKCYNNSYYEIKIVKNHRLNRGLATWQVVNKMGFHLHICKYPSPDSRSLLL